MTEPFDEHELGVIAGLLRGAIRKVERNRAGSISKWGEAYDPSANDSRLALLEGAYRKAGKDPARITNRPRKDPA